MAKELPKKYSSVLVCLADWEGYKLNKKILKKLINIQKIHKIRSCPLFVNVKTTEEREIWPTGWLMVIDLLVAELYGGGY